MFEDFDEHPYGILDTFYRTVRLLCILVAYVATLAVFVLVICFLATLIR